MPFVFKHEDYFYEEEIRFVGNFIGTEPSFREKKGTLVPYKEICLPKECLKTITLGPCLDFKKAEYSLKKFLEEKGFGHVRILQSQIPYRNL